VPNDNERLSEKWEGEAPAEPRTATKRGSAGASPSRNPAFRTASESRIANLVLNAPAPPKLDGEFEEVTAGEERTKSVSFRTKWAALKTFIGSEQRIRLIAEVLVATVARLWEACKSAEPTLWQAWLPRLGLTLVKPSRERQTQEVLDHAIRQLVSKAMRPKKTPALMTPSAKQSPTEVINPPIAVQPQVSIARR